MVEVHKDITDSTASKIVLGCKRPCQDEPLDVADGTGSRSRKYGAEDCLSMVLLDPVEGISSSKTAVKHQGTVSTQVNSRAWVKFGRASLALSDRDEIAGGFQLNDKHINYT